MITLQSTSDVSVHYRIGLSELIRGRGGRQILTFHKISNVDVLHTCRYWLGVLGKSCKSCGLHYALKDWKRCYYRQLGRETKPHENKTTWPCLHSYTCTSCFLHSCFKRHQHFPCSEPNICTPSLKRNLEHGILIYNM